MSNKFNSSIIEMFSDREALFRNIFGSVDTPKILYDDEKEQAKTLLTLMFEYDPNEIRAIFPSTIDEVKYFKSLNAIFNFSAGAEQQEKK